MKRLPAFGVDVTCVVAFVLAGRGSHAADPAVQSLPVVLAAFLLGLVVGWLAVLVAGLRADGWPAGVTVFGATLLLGLTLRALLFDGGVAWPFPLVAGGVLAATLLGWRLVAWALLRGRAGTPDRAGSSRAGS